MPAERIAEQAVRNLRAGSLDAGQPTKRVGQSLAFAGSKAAALDGWQQYVGDDRANEDVELFDVGEALLDVVHPRILTPAAAESIA